MCKAPTSSYTLFSATKAIAHTDSDSTGLHYRRRRSAGAAYAQTGSPAPGDFTSAYASTYQHPSPRPGTAGLELGQAMTWQSPTGTAGGYYHAAGESKPEGGANANVNAAAGQPLLAELGDTVYRPPPGEIYTTPAVELPATATHPQPQYGRDGYQAELADSDTNTARYSAQSQSHSPYSPPYQRSHF
jgi:hypothetical protein